MDARRRRFLYRIEANSFLRHMVRAMVAAMVDVGRGKLTANQVATILDGLDRHAAPANAPPAVCTSSKSATDGAIALFARFACVKPLGLSADARGLCKNHHDP